jgi:hypothetical protein
MRMRRTTTLCCSPKISGMLGYSGMHGIAHQTAKKAANSAEREGIVHVEATLVVPRIPTNATIVERKGITHIYFLNYQGEGRKPST